MTEPSKDQIIKEQGERIICKYCDGPVTDHSQLEADECRIKELTDEIETHKFWRDQNAELVNRIEAQLSKANERIAELENALDNLEKENK